MRNTTRIDRQIHYMNPRRLDQFRHEKGLWHEPAEEQARVRAELRRRRRRMEWVRAAMVIELSLVQRRAVEMHYLESKTFREIGRELGLHHTSVHRACERGVARLRAAARRRARGV